MNRNYKGTNVSTILPMLFNELIRFGDEVGSRAGLTKELTHVGITLEKPWQREVLVPGRKTNIAAQIVETMWVLSGRDDLEILGKYLPRAYDFSDDGETWRAGYGARLRAWPSDHGLVDQLAVVVDALKANALTRQAVMTIWDPARDNTESKDIPCNNWITFSNRLGELDMHVGIRSNDAMWGWSGINAFEWSALQEIVAGLVGVGVGKLHFSTTSFHLYQTHWEKATRITKECLPTEPVDRGKDSPRFGVQLVAGSLEKFDQWAEQWWGVEYDIRTGSPLAHHYVDEFPEPMLQSWLRVLQWWWGHQGDPLAPLRGTALELATKMAVQPKRDIAAATKIAKEASTSISELRPGKLWEMLQEPVRSDFITAACKLHLEKHEAYGDSWKRRGEMVSILANVARKVDRLGGAETSDETSADTAMDLMVYLAKYRTWLTDAGWGAGKPSTTVYSDDPHWANELLLKTDAHLKFDPNEKGLQEYLEGSLKSSFEDLFRTAEAGRERYSIVNGMLGDAYRLARLLWERAQGVDHYLGADHD